MSKNPHKYQKIRILIAVAIGWLLIILLGSIMYSNIFGLSEKLDVLFSPNNFITHSHDIQSELTQMQSYIRAYTYSSDNVYLQKYQHTEKELKKSLDELSGFVIQSQQNKYDSLLKYIDNKKQIIDKFVNLQEEFDGQTDFSSAFNTLSDLAEEADSSDYKSSFIDKIKGFFKAGNNKELSGSDKSIEVTENTLQNLVNDLQSGFEKEEQLMELQEIIEMELLKQDLKIMDKIRVVLTEMIQQEEEIFTTEKEITISKIKDSLWLIGILSGISLFVIAILVIRVFKDLNKNEASNQKLLEAKQKAEELNQAKARFVSYMSHEIRTPLTAIIGFAEQLKKNDYNNKDRLLFTDIIYSSSNHLLNIVNEILTFSKIEAGKVELDEHEFDLKKTIHEVSSVMNIKAKEKGNNFSLNTAPNCPGFVVGDEQKIRQILINLLGNAIKFTENGKIEMNTHVIEEGSDIIDVEIIVKDSGIGIEKDKTKEIFGEFKQFGSSTSKASGGTGLGLAITQEYLNLMKGNLKVESEINEGSEFIVRLPLKISGTKEEYKNKQKSTQDDNYRFTQPINVLLVDDDNFNRMLGKVVLEKMNLFPDLATNGNEAIELVKQKNYDIILMDIHMPETDGLETTQLIREYEKVSRGNATIIALTAAVMKEDLKKFSEVGINTYLLKPFKEKEMFDVIKKSHHM